MSDNEDQGTRRSSRSRAKKSKNADVFEQIKQIRREGKVHRQNVDELVEDLYEEIDEEEYAEKYGADEFVVDDDGSGYVDNGQDDDEDPYYAANEKEQKKKERRAGKVKKGALDNFFSAVIPSKKETELVAPEKVDEDLNAMLAEIAGSDNIYDDLTHEREPEKEDEFIPTPNKFKRNRPFSPDTVTPPSKVPRKHVKLTKKVQPTIVQKSPALPPTSSQFDNNDDFDFGSNDFDDVPSPPPQPQISKKEENVLSKKFNRELSFEEEKQPETPKKTTSKKNDMSQIDFDESKLNFFEEEKQPETPKKTFETSKKNDMSQIDFDESKLNFFEGEESSPQTTIITDSDVSKTGYFKDTRSLRFYWFDAYEDAKNPGKVHLFGFVKKEGVFEFESCCVTIDKILHRNQETHEPVSDFMLYKEVNDLLVKQYKIPVFKIHDKVSYCRREFKAVVSKVELDLVNIMPNMQNAPLPPCKMMALNIITVACPKTNKPHIVLITVLRSSTYYLDRRTQTKWDQKITYVAPPPGATFPFQFQQDIEKRKLQIEKCSNE
uniref:DNA polymerase alpha catalytic subunit N-terminal domain-containing protein n=1 Tax=Panagrolaimus sp. ES5 TaxID=591445 RepID=A0AC34FIP2_9BILA